MILFIFLVDFYCFWRMGGRLGFRQPPLPWLPRCSSYIIIKDSKLVSLPLSARDKKQGLINPSFCGFLSQQDILSEIDHIVWPVGAPSGSHLTPFDTIPAVGSSNFDSPGSSCKISSLDLESTISLRNPGYYW